jgi:N-methylhydantoinase A/oxoprolinase/acetone carboxylase beta subunit
MYSLGCDIGGTFTDFALFNHETGEVEVGKRLTTPGDPSEGVMTGINKLGEKIGNCLGDTAKIIHGTTLIINAIIERKGAKTALITTDGFRDVIEIGREKRYDLYDIYGPHYPETSQKRAQGTNLSRRNDTCSSESG